MLSQLKYRLSTAMDFLAQLIETQNPSLLLRLQTTSLLLTGSDYLGRNDIHSHVIKFADQIPSMAFHTIQTNAACLVDDGQSTNVSNAMAAIICAKTNRTNDASNFLKAIQESISQSHIAYYYAPGTRKDLLTENISERQLGIPIVACLSVFKRTGDESYLWWAKQLMEIAHAKGRYDHLDIWGMRVFYSIYQNQTVREKAERVINLLNQKPIEELDCHVSALRQLCNLAWVDLFDSSSQCKQIMEHHCTLQNDKTGAIQNSLDDPTVTIEGMIRGIASLLTYLSVLENQEIERLDCIL